MLSEKTCKEFGFVHATGKFKIFQTITMKNKDYLNNQIERSLIKILTV